jgi:16S rRNA (uracil1498-N3)-methyltransferase
MRIHRVLIPALVSGEVILTGHEAHHLAKVLRVTAGQTIKAFDGQGLEATGIIQNISDVHVVLNLQEPEPSQIEASIHITLAVALLKGDKLSDVVRQATELGVVAIQPFVSNFCDVRELSSSKLERLRRVAQEAAKQSGRSVVPVVHDVIKLESLNISPPTLVAHPHASATLNDVLKNLHNITLITGPEGGLSQEEINILTQHGATSIRLGARILRAETAPIAMISAILLPEAL